MEKVIVKSNFQPFQILEQVAQSRSEVNLEM